MVVWYDKGYLTNGDENKKLLESIIEKVNTDILEGNKKVSIVDLYKDYLNLDFYKTIDLHPECFVDPEHWGWDKSGFHDLTKECAQIPLVHMKDIYSGIMDGIKTDNDEPVPFDLDGDIFYYTFAGKGPYKMAINLEKIYLNGYRDGLERGKNAANDE